MAQSKELTIVVRLDETLTCPSPMDYKDHRYVKKRTCKETKTGYFSCVKFRHGCNARLIVKDGVVHEKNELLCKATVAQAIVDVRKEMAEGLRAVAVEQAALSCSAVWEAVRDEIRELYPDAPLRYVPKQSGMSVVKNTRMNVFGFDIFRVVEADGARLLSDEDSRPFLQFNVSETAADGTIRRMLGFGHPDLIRLLRYPGITLFIDGTFKVAPIGFSQCLIIMAYDPGVDLYVPVFFVLFDGRDQDIYWNVLNWVILRSDRRLEPASVTCDFELALMNAVTDQFPTATVVGCLFHFKQALRKKLVELRIPAGQIADAMTPGKLDVLTVIPVEEIADKGIRYVQSVVDDTGNRQRWREFWAYFRRTWIGRYDPSTWNVNAMAASGVELVNRTNNPLEKYNRDFGERFSAARPSLLTFIDVAKADSLRYVQLITDICNGVAEPPQHATSVQVTVPDESTAFE